ncbi:radical SAM protein [Methanogenium sp. MK-MG]|uniref:radical SAM protein n=1 Tax=Methanogenium sp. MK-MG TaxID=2599926 RepID=UPI0013EC768A|nr:radical SAM protein [Methanogenium sp. MK-MG]KAF1078125.1 hypothetical protein MKMG_00931 [Methanogenium sp. MK-MG]
MKYETKSPIDQVERICISVNSRCNYRCKYCYFFNPENHISNKSFLHSEEIEFILNQAFAYHERNNFSKSIKINFVGSGEPLLNWNDIAKAVSNFWDKHPSQERIRLYMVTNGSLITPKIAEELNQLRIFPSVSLDGPKELHNKYRVFRDGKGTFDTTMKGISVLREAGFDVPINTTLSRNLLENVEDFLDFVIKYRFEKIIFDRLVDAPDQIDTISEKEYYDFLLAVANSLKKRNLDHIEIGNLEAYKRNILGVPDQVCTMFGGSCGAGTHSLIYLGKKVYPCGRMFGKSQWLLGRYDQEIEQLQKQMYNKIISRNECLSCPVSRECIRDCLLEYNSNSSNCKSRQEFLQTFKLSNIERGHS